MGQRFFTIIFRIALGMVFILGASIVAGHASEMSQSRLHIVTAAGVNGCTDGCCGTALHKATCSAACSASIFVMTEMSHMLWRDFSPRSGVERPVAAWVGREVVPDLSPPRTMLVLI